MYKDKGLVYLWGRVCYIERSMVYRGKVLAYIKKGIIKKELNPESSHLI